MKGLHAPCLARCAPMVRPPAAAVVASVAAGAPARSLRARAHITAAVRDSSGRQAWPKPHVAAGSSQREAILMQCMESLYLIVFEGLSGSPEPQESISEGLLLCDTTAR
jgi:hypothetical protein